MHVQQNIEKHCAMELIGINFISKIFIFNKNTWIKVVSITNLFQTDHVDTLFRMFQK